MTTTPHRPPRRFTRRSTQQQDDVLLDGLLGTGARAAFGHGGSTDAAELERHVLALTVVAPEVDARGALSAHLVRALSTLYEHGWQPAEVLHVVANQWTQRVTRLATAVVVHEAAASSAATTAPAQWVAQLQELGPNHTQAALVVGDWVFWEALSPADGWRDGLRLLGQLQVQPPLTPLLARPSEWGRTAERAEGQGAGSRAGGGSADTKTLTRIRALLAKAESTDFPDEADAFTAKAQDLMTRHSIDVAMLAAREHTPSGVTARRVMIDDPYASAKVQLLDAVARANDVRVVWQCHVGMATAVGHPDDLELVELVFTSLLVQATRAMAETGRAGLGAAKRFRRGFLFAYATRIGERLEQAQADAREEAGRTYGAELVPVLARRAAEVDTALTTMFPLVRSARRTRVDARGWAAGTAAADRADLRGLKGVKG
ncbi:MAG: DUF2786 domain-containing protein [Mycobacteriaceae bacterium]